MQYNTNKRCNAIKLSWTYFYITDYFYNQKIPAVYKFLIGTITEKTTGESMPIV